MSELKSLHLTELPPELVTWVLYKSSTQQLIILGDLIDHTLKNGTVTRAKIIT